MSYQKFTKDVGIIGLTSLVMALRGLIILPIITKLLGAENYGIWAQIMVTLSLLTPPVTLGLPYTLIRFLAAEKERKKIQDGIYSVLAIIFIVALIVGLILILFSAPISNFLGAEPILIKILAFLTILHCINIVFLHIFRTFQEVKKHSFFVIFQAFGEAGLVTLVVSLGYGLFGAVLSLLITEIISFLMMGICVVRKIGIKIPRFLRTKEYLSFGLPTIPSNISSWIIQSSDRYLIGFFLGTLFVGYYAPAYILCGAINFFVSPFAFLLPAVLFQAYDGNKINEVKTYFKYSLKYFLMISIPAVFGLSILSKQLLTIFSTSEIAQQGHLVIPIVALGMLPMGANAIIAQILALTKKTKIGGAIETGGAFLNLGLNFIFIPRFGIIGAAITTLIAYTFIFILVLGYSFKVLKFKFEIDWKFISKSIFASVLMTLFIIWFYPMGLLKTIIAIVLGAFIYGILIFLFKGFGKKEFRFFKGLLSQARLKT